MMLVKDLFQAAPLIAPVAGLSIQQKDFRQAGAGLALDLAVELDEGHAELFGEPRAQRGLAGAAQSDQGDAALGGGARWPEALAQQPARLGEVGGRQPLELVDGKGEIDGPLGRVADQRGGLDAERLGELAQHQQRGIAGAALELGQVALRDARRLGQRLPRHAAAGTGEAHALADALEVGFVRRRRPAPRVCARLWGRRHAVLAIRAGWGCTIMLILHFAGPPPDAACSICAILGWVHETDILRAMAGG